MRLLVLAVLVAAAAAETVTHSKTSSAGGSSFGGRTTSRRRESSFSNVSPGDIQLGTRFNNRRRNTANNRRSEPAPASFAAAAPVDLPVPVLDMPKFNVPKVPAVRPFNSARPAGAIGSRFRPATGAAGVSGSRRPLGAAIGSRPLGAAAAARPLGSGHGSVAASLQGQLNQIGAQLANIQAQLGM